MKHILLFIISLLAGFFSVFLYSKMYQDRTVEQAKKAVHVVEKSTPFSVSTPPTKSKKGQIVHISGDVFWESRTATEPARITSARQLQQGESLYTGPTGLAGISLDESFLFDLAADTKLSLLQTLPEQIVLGQDGGSVTYKNSSDSLLSVRVLPLLVVMKEAEMMVAVDDGTIAVTVQSGSVQIAFNDLENIVTKVELMKGQKYLFDDETRVGEILE
jgi:hypothetical protein